MTDRTHEPAHDPHDLVSGYLVDALDPQELERFLVHLPDCAECRQTIKELAETVADLASASHAVPPQAVEDRLLASLFGDELPADAQGTQTRPTVTTLPSRRRWLWPAAAAAAFILGATLVTSLGLSHSPDEAVVAGQSQLVREVTSASDAKSMRLPLPRGAADVVISHGMRKAVIVASDLPIPPNGAQYHVWTLGTDGSMASAGAFSPDESGAAAMMLQADLSDTMGFAMSVDDPSATQPGSALIAKVML